MKRTLSRRGLIPTMNTDLNKMPRLVKLRQFFCRHLYEVAIITGQRTHIFPDNLNTMDETQLIVYCPKCRKRFVNEYFNFRP
jgi:hypothetical protein